MRLQFASKARKAPKESGNLIRKDQNLEPAYSYFMQLGAHGRHKTIGCLYDFVRFPELPRYKATTVQMSDGAGLTSIYCLNNLLHMRFQGRPMFCAQHQNAKGACGKDQHANTRCSCHRSRRHEASLLDKSQQKAVPGRRPACLEADRYIVSSQSMRHRPRHPMV